MASDKVTHVNDSTFEAEVLKSDVPVLVDFWAPWCGPCRAIAPIMDELADEYDGRLKVVKINTDESLDVASKYRIRSIPTVMVFKNGDKAGQLMGAAPKSKFTSFVDGML